MSEDLFSIRNELGPVADDTFVKRWSPRAMVKTEISDQDLRKMIDAARWTPSCFNDQPWHFVFSTAETYDHFLSLLMDSNQVWCKNAGRIGFVLARKHFQQTGEPNAFSQFDTGAAWMSFVYQAYTLGYVMHGLGGIHKDRAIEALHVDTDKYDLMCGLVIGKLGAKQDLDPQLQEREKPSTRKDLDEMYNLNQMQDTNKLCQS